MPAAESSILDPRVARAIFERAASRLPLTRQSIPSPVQASWEVVARGFPEVTVQLEILGQPALQIVLNCLNYDYDPPAVGFRRLSGQPIRWSEFEHMARLYSGVVKGVQSDRVRDIVIYPNGGGFICLEGNAGFHQAHPERSWFALRTTPGGKLHSVIATAIAALNLEAVGEAVWT